MKFIARTLAQKEAATNALDTVSSYQKYSAMVKQARADQFSEEQILEELEAEKERVLNDQREGDHLFQLGLKNAKSACLAALNMLIKDLNDAQ